MNFEIRNVRFAHKKEEETYKKQEETYKRSAESMHPEDKKIYLLKNHLRKNLWNNYHKGDEVPKGNIPEHYIEMFHIDNLWQIDIRYMYGVLSLLYSIAGDEILIIHVTM